MNKLEKISILNEKVNLLLELIANFKLDDLSQAEMIAGMALEKGKNTALYAEEIKLVLVHNYKTI